MRFLKQSWPVWAGVLLYAGAALKFALAATSGAPPLPQWVWWSVNAAFTATFLVAIQVSSQRDWTKANTAIRRRRTAKTRHDTAHRKY